MKKEGSVYLEKHITENFILKNEDSILGKYITKYKILLQRGDSWKTVIKTALE